MNGLYTSDTIVALATATGAGAIGVIRLSGKEAIAIADTIFKAHHAKPLAEVATHTVHLGVIEAEGQQIDEFGYRLQRTAFLYRRASGRVFLSRQ